MGDLKTDKLKLIKALRIISYILHDPLDLINTITSPQVIFHFLFTELTSPSHVLIQK